MRIGDQRTTGTGVSPELLPRADESAEAYLERLKALQTRVSALIDAIEDRRPALQVPGDTDRRLAHERRSRAGERRLGLPDPRPVTVDRRAQPPIAPPADRPPRFRMDGTAVMWAVQVALWVAVVVLVILV